MHLVLRGEEAMKNQEEIEIEKHQQSTEDSFKLEDLEAVLEVGLSALSSEGIILPKNPSYWKTKTAFFYTKLRFLFHSLHFEERSLVNKNPEMDWALELLGKLLPLAFFYRPRLFQFLTLKGIHLSYQYGKTPFLPIFLAAYGVVLSQKFENLTKFYSLEQQVLEMLKREKIQFEFQVEKSREKKGRKKKRGNSPENSPENYVQFFLGILLNVWKKEDEFTMRSYLREAYRLAQERIPINKIPDFEHWFPDSHLQEGREKGEKRRQGEEKRKEEKGKEEKNKHLSNQKMEAKKRKKSILENEDFRSLLVELMKLSLHYWEYSENSSKIELSEKSEIWGVYLDGGVHRTRTLDKYLDYSTLPQKARWQNVLKTAEYVLESCVQPSYLREEIQKHFDSAVLLLRQYQVYYRKKQPSQSAEEKNKKI